CAQRRSRRCPGRVNCGDKGGEFRPVLRSVPFAALPGPCELRRQRGESRPESGPPVGSAPPTAGVFDLWSHIQPQGRTALDGDPGVFDLRVQIRPLTSNTPARTKVFDLWWNYSTEGRTPRTRPRGVRPFG